VKQIGCRAHPARAGVLDWMQRQGLIPKHQILDNQASAEYKAAIEASSMTYELIPPEEHRRNMAEKAIQTFKDHFVSLVSLAVAPHPCQSIHDVNFCRKSNGNSFSFNNPKHIQTYLHMHMSMNTTTTTDTSE
jgi:hypothetical protein